MPNRILRDGILTSEAVNSLDWAAEVFFRRLMSVADDHGRYHASPKLLRAHCYPLHIDTVADADVDSWVRACEGAGLVERYLATDGKVYLQLLKFGQQVRAKSKFPEPDGSRTSDGIVGGLPPAVRDQPKATCDAPASNCAQVISDAHLVGVVSEVGVGVGVGGDTPPNPPPAPPSAKRTIPRSQLTLESLPEDWRDKATEALPGWDHDGLFRAFRLHHVGKGTQAASWIATWGTWLEHAPEYSRKFAPASERQMRHPAGTQQAGRYTATIHGLTGRDRQPETIDVESREITPSAARRLG